jgi:N-acetylmuramoyl-L-alanine amidase
MDLQKLCLTQLVLGSIAASAAFSIGSSLQAAVTDTPAVSSSAFETTPSGYTVVIDPGHGGHDKGASKNGANESLIALEISKMLAEKLQKNGYKVLMTRSKDESISLEKRAAIANRSNADLLISIHLNSSTDARAQGKEFYFQNQLAVDEEALFLANRENHEHEDPSMPSVNPGQDRVQKSGLRAAETARLPTLNIANPGVRSDVKNILEDLDRSARVRRSSELAKILHREWMSTSTSALSGRGIRQAPFFLVSTVAMPSVLVEVGFLSHPKERARLQRREFQASLADSLANGIDQYFKRP